VRVLVIEDEPKVSGLIERGLQKEGYEVEICGNGREGAARLASKQHDLLVLDIMLPEKSGWEILKEARQAGLATPILVLTARDAVEDRVAALDLGADDFLAKPFALTELAARVRALLRRHQQIADLILRYDDLALDTRTRTVTRGGKTIELTTREYTLLEFLLKHPEDLLTRDMISKQIWNLNHTESSTNVIDVYVNYLRRKVDRGFPVSLIQTVRGVGYRLKSESRDLKVV